MAIPSEVRLRLYNSALRRVGERKLASATENREPRRVLDDAWGTDDAVIKYVLERGDWNFGLRAVELTPNPSLEPAFGYRFVYSKPDDFCRMNSLSADARLSRPLTFGEYRDESNYWWADHDPLYVSYVSDGDEYGRNHASWTETFREVVELKLAYEIADRIADSMSKKRELRSELRDALAAAKSTDAMGEGVKFPVVGNWVRARASEGYRRR